MEKHFFKTWTGRLHSLAHPTRLAIVEKLLNQPRCVNDIKELMEVSQPNLSQHLNLLKQQQIVDCYEDGKKRCYFLCCPEFIRGLFDLLENDFTARDPEKVKKIFLNKND